MPAAPEHVVQAPAAESEGYMTGRSIGSARPASLVAPLVGRLGGTGQFPADLGSNPLDVGLLLLQDGRGHTCPPDPGLAPFPTGAGPELELIIKFLPDLIVAPGRVLLPPADDQVHHSPLVRVGHLHQVTP